MPAPDLVEPKQQQGQIANLAAYKFITLDSLEARRVELRELCQRLQLMGTILLSGEGINMFLAGTVESIHEFVEAIRSKSEFADLEIKLSYSDYQPFSRMLVKIKNEIIAFGIDEIDPRKRTSPKLTATELKQWLDEGRPVNLLDVRNDYEVEVGTFENAIAVGVDNFRDFPEAVKKLPSDFRERPTVMFCTGGIRCEKAGPMMEQAGFENIYQLDGGILKYFEDCGGAHYNGDCFVFDKRVALDPELNESDFEQCYSCQAVLTKEDQESIYYHPPRICPHCYVPPTEQTQQSIAERHRRLNELAENLPGCTPYENRRPINVPTKYATSTLIDFLCDRHPHVEREYWLEEIALQRIVHRGIDRETPTSKTDSRSKITPEMRVSEGQRFDHIFPDTIEPAVNARIEILHEDNSLVVVNKPAPLPVHPSGRFNLNTLQGLLNEVYAPQRLRLAHRLDANTTGVVLLCRTRAIANRVLPQFESGEVNKTYIARVHGHVKSDRFDCRESISASPATSGLRVIDESGLPAVTQFEVIERLNDSSTLLKVEPTTGRTNQIRVHLWHLGHPIVGDPCYLPNRELGNNKSLEIDDEPLCLHASRLEFTHPESKQRVAFESAAPISVWINER